MKNPSLLMASFIITIVQAGSAHAVPTGVATLSTRQPDKHNVYVSNPWYHGGYLIGQPEIHAIYWGSGVRFVPQLNQFYADTSNSTFFEMLGEYQLGGFVFGRGTMPSGYVWDEAPAGNYFSDGDIESALGSLLDAGVISATPNALYMVHFPPGTTIEMGGGTSCAVWCAYHGRFWWNNHMIYYGVVPDHGGGCSSGCGGGWQTPDEFSRTCVSASHEVIESMTDPEGTGWFDDEGYEISDICNGQPVRLGKWWVQKQWSNAHNACVSPQ